MELRAGFTADFLGQDHSCTVVTTKGNKSMNYAEYKLEELLPS